MPDKSVLRVDRSQGERNESSKVLKTLDPSMRRDDGKGINQRFPGFNHKAHPVRPAIIYNADNDGRY